MSPFRVVSTTDEGRAGRPGSPGRSPGEPPCGVEPSGLPGRILRAARQRKATERGKGVSLPDQVACHPLRGKDLTRCDQASDRRPGTASLLGAVRRRQVTELGALGWAPALTRGNVWSDRSFFKGPQVRANDFRAGQRPVRSARRVDAAPEPASRGVRRQPGQGACARAVQGPAHCSQRTVQTLRGRIGKPHEHAEVVFYTNIIPYCLCFLEKMMFFRFIGIRSLPCKEQRALPGGFSGKVGCSTVRSCALEIALCYFS